MSLRIWMLIMKWPLAPSDTRFYSRRARPGQRISKARCVTLFCSEPVFALRYAAFQGICGLPGPRSSQETQGRRVHRDQPGRAGRRARPCRLARRDHAGGPHQRRGPRHPRGLLRRNAQKRCQLPGDVQEGEERTGAQVQGGAVMRGPDIKTEEPYRISRDKINVLARAVSEALATLDGVEF